MLLTDSLSEQTDEFLMDSIFPEKIDFLEVVTIPPGTTGFFALLDVYPFWQYKILVQRIYDQAVLESSGQ